MKRHLQCAEQQVSRSNLTKYCACHEKWLDCFNRPHIWNVISNARSKQVSLSNLAKYCACHENWHCKMSKKISKNRWNVISNAGPIRPWSEHDPSMIRPWSDHENANRNPPRKWGYFSSSPGAFSIVKYNVSSPILHSNLHQILRLSRRKTHLLNHHYIWNLILQCAEQQVSRSKPHQILRLSRRKTRILSPHHIWNVIYSARSNRCHHPTSPNTAPATKNDSTALSSSHMKRHFQCAEPTGVTIQPHQILRLPRKMTLQDFKGKSPKTGETSFPMRGRSDHDPSMIRAWSDHENANRNPPRKWGYFSSSPRAFSIVKYNVSPPILHSNLHQILRLPQKDTLDLHQVLHLPRKVTLELHQVLRLPRKMTSSTSASIAPATNSDTWTSASTAPATKSDTWTSPSTAPATVL